MVPTTTLTLVDGVRVVVPDSLDLITPYVLREQEDWFEDEIRLLRRLLQPGQTVIDIGASYGVYTLSMAQTVGPTGSVFAFGPASSAARLLAAAIAANGFAHVTLRQSAVSATSGTGHLSLETCPELNALAHGKPTLGATELVSLVTLDDCLQTYGWRDIEFVKIDAEGEEARILKGGKRFFAELSPLVQYEVKAGAVLHLELVQAFAGLGYDSYRLVPGLDLLVPFDAESPPDGYLLNLFCCKPDRVARLAARGLLLNSVADHPYTGKRRLEDAAKKIGSYGAYDWRYTLANFPYGAQLADLWERTMAEGDSAEVAEALSFYALSRDSSLSTAERFGALEASFGRFKFLCDGQPSHLRLASLARVARDHGARSLAVSALTQLSNAIFQHNRVDTSEPFLAPCERFDTIPPREALGNWVLSAVLEELERLSAFSSFYTGASARRRLEIIRDLGFGSAEMQRRLSLLQQRFGLPTR